MLCVLQKFLLETGPFRVCLCSLTYSDQCLTEAKTLCVYDSMLVLSHYTVFIVFYIHIFFTWTPHSIVGVVHLSVATRQNYSVKTLYPLRNCGYQDFEKWRQVVTFWNILDSCIIQWALLVDKLISNHRSGEYSCDNKDKKLETFDF